MSANEMIDVLNDEGKVIDTISRELAEQGNHITQNVLVFVFNSSGGVWVQLRPKNKSTTLEMGYFHLWRGHERCAAHSYTRAWSSL